MNMKKILIEYQQIKYSNASKEIYYDQGTFILEMPGWSEYKEIYMKLIMTTD